MCRKGERAEHVKMLGAVPIDLRGCFEIVENHSVVLARSHIA